MELPRSRRLGYGAKRTRIQRAGDREAITRLLQMHFTQARIAAELQLSESMVSRDIGAIQQEWLLRASASQDRRMAAELAKIDLVEQEAWRAWQNSKGSQEKPRAPETRYLQSIQWAVEQRCKLAGLYPSAGASVAVQLNQMNVMTTSDPQLQAIRQLPSPVLQAYIAELEERIGIIYPEEDADV